MGIKMEKEIAYHGQIGRFKITDYIVVDNNKGLISANQLSTLELRAAIYVFSNYRVGGSELKFARKALGFSRDDFVKKLGYHPAQEDSNLDIEINLQYTILGMLYKEYYVDGDFYPSPKETLSVEINVPEWSE